VTLVPLSSAGNGGDGEGGDSDKTEAVITTRRRCHGQVLERACHSCGGWETRDSPPASAG